MLKKLSLAALVACLGVCVASAQAGGRQDCCDVPKTCYGEPEVKKEKKHGWDVECKDICIPRFRFPWESCCEPRCGRVRTVHVLKKKDACEVEKCYYKWHIVPACESCRPTGSCCGK